jgi:quinol monooxygenase YgiN
VSLALAVASHVVVPAERRWNEPALPVSSVSPVVAAQRSDRRAERTTGEEQVLVVTRYAVPPEEAAEFRERCRAALEALVACPGCTGGSAGPALDDPSLWVLSTTWESVGAYRRALSSYQVKLMAVPLMYRALDEPSAFESLLAWTPGTGLQESRSAIAGVHDDGGAG